MQNIIGKVGTAETTVNDRNTALAVGSGNLPVFSTPMMIALMEQAACAALEGELEEGMTTVGTKISAEHLAATVSGKITATATITAVDGRRIDFEVTATDNVGEIGHGTHSRFSVGTEKFMAKATERGQ
ncbi:MAG: thioesterase family protein [Oscillospiraceae bacterium]|nr:thioesterase family protein [Oscillospiraceae bacterium]